VHTKLWAFKVVGIPILGILGPRTPRFNPLGSLETK